MISEQKDILIALDFSWPRPQCLKVNDVRGSEAQANNQSQS
jgi:hypothetical protein